MNAVIRSTSFAPGNFFTAKAFANTGASFADFIASSRLINTIKVGPGKVDAEQIIAIDRPPSVTKVKSNPAREITLVVPKGYPLGKHDISSGPDVALSIKDGTTVSEAISGHIEIKPDTGGNIAASINVVVENSDATTFQLKGDFKVLK